jgi:hypothetical protein
MELLLNRDLLSDHTSFGCGPENPADRPLELSSASDAEGVFNVVPLSPKRLPENRTIFPSNAPRSGARRAGLARAKTRPMVA